MHILVYVVTCAAPEFPEFAFGILSYRFLCRIYPDSGTFRNGITGIRQNAGIPGFLLLLHHKTQAERKRNKHLSVDTLYGEIAYKSSTVKLPIIALLHGDYLNYRTNWWVWFAIHLLTCVACHNIVIYLQHEDVTDSWYSTTNGIFWIQSILLFVIVGDKDKVMMHFVRLIQRGYTE